MTSVEIKRNRKRLGLSQAELGNLVGVTRLTISNYEKGGVIPDSKSTLLYNVLSKSNTQNLNKISENSLNKDSITANIDKINEYKEMLSRATEAIQRLKTDNSLKSFIELDGLIEFKYDVENKLKELED